MDLSAALERHFGHPAFRPGQRDAVQAALDGRDVLVVMPTGSGKSLCYQLPALLRDDLTVVVSPLVALMQDQVDALRARAGDRVGLVNAQQGQAENREVLQRAARGELRLLYVAPERFASPGFVEALGRTRIGLFVVDEAHCVSEWGHDFRPDYFRLADAARHLGAGSIVASTATATPRVAADIVARLRLREPVRVTTGFDRPNLCFAVVRCGGGRDRERRIGAALGEPDALPAIVYAGTRAETERLTGVLAHELGVPCVAYHAGLSREARAQAQRRFMTGDAPVVVATNAFGMGVDKADVRTVCHAAVPGSVEAWYQEAGRAGRDGAPARCLLFAEGRDKGLHVFFIQRARLEPADAERVVRALHAGSADGRYDMAAGELARATGGESERLRALLGHLVEAGVVQPTPAPPERVRGRLVGGWHGQARARVQALAAGAERVRWQRFRAVWGLVEGEGCRRETILRHFGDRVTGAGGAARCCDVCDPGAVGAARRSAAPARAGAGSRARRGGHGGGAGRAGAPPRGLDGAILEIVREAEPPVGRTRAVEILRGGGSKVVRAHAYDALPGYGDFAHLHADDVLAAVDAMLTAGALRSTGGRFPKLAAA